MNERGERKEIPYRVYRKKSCGIFKGTGIIFFKDPGIQRFFEKSLIGFSEKSCGNPKRTGLPIKAKKEYIL